MPIGAGTIELRELFANTNWYSVPIYQRPYVWGEDEIEPLLEDLKYASNYMENEQYFLGSIVLQKVKENPYCEYEILDGQQRLMTLFLIFTIANKLFNNQDIGKGMREFLRQEGDPLVGNPERIKILYRRNSTNKTIRNILIENDVINGIPEADGNDISSLNIRKAAVFIKQYLGKLKVNEDTEILQKVSRYVITKSIMVRVSADTQEDAFRMFTILNNRGIPLTNADILKAQNVGALDSREEERRTEDWENIENRFPGGFDDFLQYIRAIYVKEKANKSLVHEFNNLIYNRHLLEPGASTISTITTYYDIYDKVINCRDINKAKYKNLISIMRNYLDSKDWIPPLLYFYHRYENEIGRNDDILLNFLQKLEFKFSGDLIGGVTSTPRKLAMYTILKAIEREDSADRLLDNTSLFNVDQKVLYASLDGPLYAKNPPKKWLKFVLLKLEYLCSGDTTSYDILSIEHILPQTLRDNTQWKKDFTPEDENYWKPRLANLVLLSCRLNSKLGNLDFHDKVVRYYTAKGGASSLHLTQSVIHNAPEWTPRILKKRQQRLIEMYIANKDFSLQELAATVDGQ